MTEELEQLQELITNYMRGFVTTATMQKHLLDTAEQLNHTKVQITLDCMDVGAMVEELERLEIHFSVEWHACARGFHLITMTTDNIMFLEAMVNNNWGENAWEDFKDQVKFIKE